MTTASSPLTRCEDPAAERDVVECAGRGLIADYGELTKARLSAMVVLTAIVGYLVGMRGALEWIPFLSATVGTALAAASAAVLNQLWEARRDALMERTRHRPLPARRLGAAHAMILGAVLGWSGITILAVGANMLAAALALGNIALYVLAYTPLKPRSTLNTLVGAVCGAVPPMIGWAAATGGLGAGAWLLGAILFVWQLPHFLSLAWMYRDDYRRGGYAMLPVIDDAGGITCRVILLTSIMLVPVALLVTMARLAGVAYAVVALLLGLVMIAAAIRLLLNPSVQHARAVFLASIAYLPLLMLAMVLDRPAHVAPAAANEPSADLRLVGAMDRSTPAPLSSSREPH